MNKNVLTERDLMLIKEWYFNYVHDGKDTEESEALYYKIDAMLDDKLRMELTYKYFGVMVI